eukprot:jgi/Bigna1/146101/aug1.109_g20809
MATSNGVRSNDDDGGADKRLPVTVLSGFLGSGKTTMMKWLLENKEGMKIAVIVNDMAELNIDANLINNSMKKSGGDMVHFKPTGGTDMVELQNGCICCNLREDLLIEVHKMASQGKFDYMVIESSGICEPRPIAETFSMDVKDSPPRAMPSNRTESRLKVLNATARLDTMVSVVDCQRFWENMNSLENVANSNADIMAALSFEVGDKMTMLEDLSQGWYKAKLNEQTGYVAADYVKKLAGEGGERKKKQPVGYNPYGCSRLNAQVFVFRRIREVLDQKAQVIESRKETNNTH